MNEKSKTPFSSRTPLNKVDLTPTRPSPLPQSPSHIKNMLKEQILKKNLGESRISNKIIKNFPFTNKKVNLNLNQTQNDSSNEFHKFFQRDMSNPEIMPISMKQQPLNKMEKLLKNLQITNSKPTKDINNLTLILAQMKRDNSPGRLSQRSSTSEIRAKNQKKYNTNLTPINRSRKNSPEKDNKNAPYLSIKDYLNERNKKEDIVKTPIKNENKKDYAKYLKEELKNENMKNVNMKNEDKIKNKQNMTNRENMIKEDNLNNEQNMKNGENIQNEKRENNENNLKNNRNNGKNLLKTKENCENNLKTSQISLKNLDENQKNLKNSQLSLKNTENNEKNTNKKSSMKLEEKIEANENIKSTKHFKNCQNQESSTEKKIKQIEDLKITIKEDLNVEESKDSTKITEFRKKPDFLLNVNINIENNLRHKEEDNTKNFKNIINQKAKVMESFKNYDSKLTQLINCQKKANNMNNNSDLNLTIEKNKDQNNNTDINSNNNKNIKTKNNNAKTLNNFFENSITKTVEKKNEESMNNVFENLKKEENNLIEQPNLRTLQNVITLEETLTNITKCFKENQKIIGHCKSYLNIVAEGNLEFFETLYEHEKHKTAIKEMIILERIVVITVISLSFDKTLNPKYVKNCINLLEYIHQNFIMFIELILEKIKHTQENESSLENLKKILILKKTRDTSRVLKSEIIRKNLTIIMKILQIFVKENKFEPFPTINNLLESLDKMTITDSTQYLMQCFYSLIIDLEEKMGTEFEEMYTLEENLSEEQLSYVAPPFLPELPPEKKNNTYTLVIDLDETLVHYEELDDGSGQFLLRPYSELFLEDMSKYFEVVIFTAALQDYADYILNIMDEKNQFISYRLYRKHTVHNGAIYVKDLSKIGRDLNKVIIIDNLADNFQNQPENGIFIQSWYGEPDDKALYYLAPLLKEIVNKKYDDVRVALQKFKEKMIENINKGVTAPHINLNLD